MVEIIVILCKVTYVFGSSKVLSVLTAYSSTRPTWQPKANRVLSQKQRNMHLNIEPTQNLRCINFKNIK